jgi:hypothetical protein
MILGITVLLIISSIPFIGWFISLIAVWWALGGIIQSFCYKK